MPLTKVSYSLIEGAPISLLDFGAVGDGVADDTAAIQAAVNACGVNQWIDGNSQTYKITSVINGTSSTFKLCNAKFVFNSDYANQGRFALNAGSGTTAMTVELKDVIVDGGRGTYKVGLETWTVFSSFGGYDSIRPTLVPVFLVTAYNISTTVKINNVNFYNVHADACIEIGTYGTVFIDDCEYENISNKTFHVYHSPDDGVTQNGRTLVNNVYAEDIGLMPSSFLVDTVSKVRADPYAPQGSFNFIVSHGDFALNNAVVRNYASCGVTADRNRSFNANNIFIINGSGIAFSNNPSGAFFLEDCNTSNVSNLFVWIIDRNSRDYALDSSSVQIFASSGSQTNFNNVVLLSDPSTAKINKIIRGSLLGNAAVTISNFYISGLPVNYQNAISMLYLPNTAADADVRLINGFMSHGGITIERPNISVVDKVVLNGSGGTADITFAIPGNVGVTETSTDMSVINCSIDGSILCQIIVDGKLIFSHNKIGGGIAANQNNTCNIIVSENSFIGGNITVNGASSEIGQVIISNNCLISGQTVISKALSAVITGNTTSEKIEIKDVQTFNITGNNARTDLVESIIDINPVVTASILAGVISSNNLLIKTGTVGALFVTIAGGVSGVTDVNNNKLTVAWT
jgi:hypothetical protein